MCGTVAKRAKLPGEVFEVVAVKRIETELWMTVMKGCVLLPSDLSVSRVTHIAEADLGCVPDSCSSPQVTPTLSQRCSGQADTLALLLPSFPLPWADLPGNTADHTHTHDLFVLVQLV